jgi:hypothetical protein
MGTLFILPAMLFPGGVTLTDLALALAVGILVGTYSSVFTATPLLIPFERLRPAEVPVRKPTYRRPAPAARRPAAAGRRPTRCRAPQGAMKRLVAVVALILSLGACAPRAGYVGRLTIVNPTEYDLLVYAKGGKEPAWLPLGIAKRMGQTPVEQVIDMGPKWVFRFDYLDEVRGGLTLSRSQLLQADWKVEIPAAIGQRLKQEGVPPAYG